MNNRLAKATVIAILITVTLAWGAYSDTDSMGQHLSALHLQISKVLVHGKWLSFELTVENQADYSVYVPDLWTEQASQRPVEQEICQDSRVVRIWAQGARMARRTLETGHEPGVQELDYRRIEPGETRSVKISVSLRQAKAYWYDAVASGGENLSKDNLLDLSQPFAIEVCLGYLPASVDFLAPSYRCASASFLEAWEEPAGKAGIIDWADGAVMKGITPAWVEDNFEMPVTATYLVTAEDRKRFAFPAMKAVKAEQARKLVCDFSHLFDHASEGEDLSPETTIVDAVLAGDVDQCRAFLEDGANVNMIADRLNNRTLLHLAVHQADLASVLLLCESGADANALDMLGETPLMHAAGSDSVELVSCLLSYGADPNCQNSSGVTPLCVAASRGKTDVIAMLVEAGAKVSVSGGEGLSPLFLAVASGSGDAVDYLLAQGADPRHVDTAGRTVRHQAVMRKDAFMDKGVSGLFDLIGPQKQHKYDPACDCCKQMPMIVDRVLAAGVPLDACSGRGETPLSLAVRTEQAGMARLLLDRGANPNTRVTSREWPLLHIAAYKGNCDLVKLLLDHGADPDARDVDGMVAFDVACIMGHESPEFVTLETPTVSAQLSKQVD